MRVDDQTKVTNAIAAAIEYISKFHASSLSGFVIKELRGANAIVSVAAKRELETMTTPDLERLARHALDTLRLRRWEEFQDSYGVQEPFLVIARELATPPFEQPRLATGTHVTSPAASEETEIAKFARLVNLTDYLDKETGTLIADQLDNEGGLSDAQRFFVIENLVAKQLGRVLASRIHTRGNETAETFLASLIDLARGHAADTLQRAAENPGEGSTS